MAGWEKSLLVIVDDLARLEPDPLESFRKSLCKLWEELEITDPQDDWDFVKNNEMRALS